MNFLNHLINIKTQIQKKVCALNKFTDNQTWQLWLLNLATDKKTTSFRTQFNLYKEVSHSWQGIMTSLCLSSELIG